MKKHVAIIVAMVLIFALSVTVLAESETVQIKAKVVENNGVQEETKENEPTKKVQNVTVRILEGEYENEEYEMVYVISEDVENNITSNLELNEKDNILVNIEEKDGEITKITYKENIKQNYTLFVLGAIILIVLIIIGINTSIVSVIIYLLTITLTIFSLIFSMKMGWNLILVASILSFLITVFYITRANGMNKKTLSMIFVSILSITFAGILMYVLFDIMGLANINIKVTENFVNIKDLICSCIIVVSCGVSNLIILVKLNIDSFFNRPYKTKSDNIIKGQRSLKL